MMHGLTQLNVPVPDHLERAIGYAGEGRYLAAWWESDECMWSNGQTTAQGYWRGFLAYTEHPLVAIRLGHVDLGNSDTPAVHYLLFDLVGRIAYIGRDWEVTRFLRENTLRRRSTALTVDVATIEREARRRTEAVNAMIEELNG